MQKGQQGYAATIGFFDGVHTGHRFLLEQLMTIAAERGQKSMAITFPEHPRQILQSDFKPRLLTSAPDKLAMLETTGIDYCFPLHFTTDLSKMCAGSFMKDFLQEKLQVRTLLVGHDHHFGHDCNCLFEDYRQMGSELGIEVLKARALDYEGLPISSSRIRRELAQGHIRQANDMLGYRYRISGTVIRGLQNGRRIGFPTANLGPYCEFLLLPADGVYAAVATVGGTCFPAMVNIGFRPTFDGRGRTIEAHLIGFDGDIYFQELTIEFTHFIRSERKFTSPEELAAQLAEDRKCVISLQNG